MSNKKTSRIDIIGQNGNDGLHYHLELEPLLNSDGVQVGHKAVKGQVPDEYQQINNIDDIILTQAWYDALLEDDEDAL